MLISSVQFEDLINYLNKRVGEIVTRIDVECDLNHIKTDLLEHYRHNLKKAGYLKIVSKNKYLILKRIPESTKIKKIREPK